MRVIDLDRQRGTLEVLDALGSESEMMFTDLKNHVNIGQHALYRAIEVLLKGNLIEEKTEQFPFRRVFKLTEKGKKVAELLLKIDKLMSK